MCIRDPVIDNSTRGRLQNDPVYGVVTHRATLRHILGRKVIY